MERVRENVQSSQLSRHISSSDYSPIANQSSFAENKIKTLDSTLNDVDDFLYNDNEVHLSRSTSIKPLVSNESNEHKNSNGCNNNKVSFYMGENFPEDSKLLANPKGIIKSFLPIVAASDPDKFDSYRKLCMAHVNEYYKHLKGEINMLCLVCNVSCQHWNTLQRHLQTHINFRPFICELCQRTFYSQNKLKRHQLIHNDIKPYKCPFCDRRVGRTEHLKRHLLVHTNDKPFGCSGCSHTTKRLDGIRRHIKRKHGIEGAKIIHIELPVDIEMLNKFREAVTSVEEMKNFENKKKFEDASKDIFDNVVDKNECTLIKNQDDMYQGFHDTFHDKDFKKNFLSDDLNFTEAIPNEKENSINSDSSYNNKVYGSVKCNSPFDSFNETKNFSVPKMKCDNLTSSDKINLIQTNGKSNEANFLSNDSLLNSSTILIKENKTITSSSLEIKNTLKTSYMNNNGINKDSNSLVNYDVLDNRREDKNNQKSKTKFEQINKGILFNKSLKLDNYKHSNKKDIQENLNNLGRNFGNNSVMLQKSGQQGKKSAKNCSKSGIVNTIDLSNISKSHNCITTKRNDDNETQKLNYIDNNLIYNTVYSKKSSRNEDNHKIPNNFSVIPPQHNHFHHTSSQEPFINNYHAEMMLSHYFQSHQRFTPPIWGFTNQNYPSY